MSKKLRILLVTVNLLVSLVLIPVVFIVSSIHWAYIRLRYRYDFKYKEELEVLIDGMKKGVNDNIRFLKTGDLSVFGL